jgi:putative ABC transport system permease protein
MWTQNLRFGLRMLGKYPASTTIALLALAIGIGSNSAIFSIVNAVLLQPLPYAAPDRLLAIWDANPDRKIKEFLVAGPNLRDTAARSRTLTLSAFEPGSSVLTGSEVPERVDSAKVATNLFDLLGVRARLGRTFRADEGRANVLVISDGLWRRKFGADPNILGRKITLDGISYEVVGVMPGEFRLLDTPSELWRAAVLDDGGVDGRGMHVLRAVGRLRDGATFEQARDELTSISAGLATEYPSWNKGWTSRAVPMLDQILGDVRSTLLTLLGAVCCVLLVACANVANLLLARSGSRQKEMAIRASLGAGSGNLIAQLLTESVMLSLAGGVLGLGLAYLLLKLLVWVGPAALPRMQDIQMDWTVVAFTFAASVATGLVFGLAPALTALRTNLNVALRQSGRGTVSSGSKHLRTALVIAEVALSVVLLAGAGLLLRSFWSLQSVNPGFQPEGTLTFRMSLPKARYDGFESAAFLRRLLEKMAALPGVASAGLTRDVPLSGGNPSLNFEIDGREKLDTQLQPRARFRIASAHYFEAIGLPLIQGRFFNESDTEKSPPVAIINQALAKRDFPNQNPIGMRMKTGFDSSPWYTIAGVVGDTHHLGLDAETGPEMYFPYLQVPADQIYFVASTTTFVLRTQPGMDPVSLASAARSEVRQLDPELAIFQVRSMDQLVNSSIAMPRFRSMLLLSFAIAALALAAIGIYGVIAYSVSQRTQEIGVRMAMGAEAKDVVGMIVGEGLRMAVAGVVAGLALALLLAGVLEKFLYGIHVRDLSTFLLTPIFLMAVAFVASYLPARRATRVDSVAALRGD